MKPALSNEAISGLECLPIADVACGTGIWAVEVAKKWLKAHVTGLDTSPDQFPLRWSLPGNVTIDVLDLFGEVGPEYHDKFDVVHVRLLAAGPLAEPRNFVKAFSKLLKPGGYIRWEEIAYPFAQRVLPPPRDGRAKGDYTSTIFRCDHVAGAAQLVHKTDWSANLQNRMLENSSFRDIEQFEVPVCPPTLKIEDDVTTAVRTMTRVVNIDVEVLNGMEEDIAKLHRA